MWELKHINGCGGACYYRSTKPELSTPLDEKECFNLDGSPIERTQLLICQSCGKALGLTEVHPDNWTDQVC